jgi:peroxiredoxin
MQNRLLVLVLLLSIALVVACGSSSKSSSSAADDDTADDDDNDDNDASPDDDDNDDNDASPDDDDNDDNDDNDDDNDDATPTIGVQDGDTEADFTMLSNLSDDDDVMVSLSDYRGKVVLLDSSATWCPYCRQETPLLESEFFAPYQNQGPGLMVLQLLGQAGPESNPRIPTLADLQNWAAQYSLTFPVLCDPNFRIGDRMGDQEIPFYWVLDTHGVIVAKSNDGGNQWPVGHFLSIVENLLNQDEDD